jgi:hypothetical protein
MFFPRCVAAVHRSPVSPRLRNGSLGSRKLASKSGACGGEARKLRALVDDLRRRFDSPPPNSRVMPTDGDGDIRQCRAPASAMRHSFLSIAEARRASQNIARYLLWIDERQCKHVHEPGWEELQPHRDGAALFLNRKRAHTGRA